MQFLNQIILLPLAAFLYSMEMFVKTLQGIQEIAGQSFKALTDEVTQTVDAAPTSERDLTGGETGGPIDDSGQNADRITQGGEGQMQEIDDLGGDDLKFVRYSILFTKRDLEATLQAEREEVVDYPTTAGSFGGLKLAEFMPLEIDRPPKWIENRYPPNIPRDQRRIVPARDIPTDDRKYITFLHRVERRLAKSAAEYERRQASALEEISQRIEQGIGEITRRITP